MRPRLRAVLATASLKDVRRLRLWAGRVADPLAEVALRKSWKTSKPCSKPNCRDKYGLPAVNAAVAHPCCRKTEARVGSPGASPMTSLPCARGDLEASIAGRE